MLVHSCLFVLLSLLPLIVYISTVLFEQINDDDDDDDDACNKICYGISSRKCWQKKARTGSEQYESNRPVDDHACCTAELNSREDLTEQHQKRTDEVQNLRRQMPFCNKTPTHARDHVGYLLCETTG